METPHTCAIGLIAGTHGRGALAIRRHCLAGHVKERLADMVGIRVLTGHTIDPQELEEDRSKG